MKVLTVANQKGGVGKSSLAVHLAWHAQAQGLKTLIVDLDSQANTTGTFTDRPEGLAASRLFEKSFDAEPQRLDESLYLIHADAALNDVEGQDLSTIQYLKGHLAALARHGFQIAIIDTPPSLGRRLLAALIASDYVVSPLTLNGYSLQGIKSLLETILMVKNTFNRRLHHLGLLPNQLNNRSKQQMKLLKELREVFGEQVLPYALAHRTAVSDAIDAGHPVWKHARGASSLMAAHEMRRAVKDILGRTMQ